VSGGTVHLRMKKMIDMGVVKGTTLSLDYSKIGWDLTAFVSVYLHDTSQYDAVKEALSKIPEVVKVHYTLGRFNMFLKVHASDAKHLKEIMHDKIETIPEILRTESVLSLEEGINRHITFPEE
ncbi:MAG: Lrp/AsnC ligand binding domain-containing protein, partial [Bacteroidota bacterium]